MLPFSNILISSATTVLLYRVINYSYVATVLPFGDLYVYILEKGNTFVSYRWRSVTQVMSIMTFFLTRLWKPCIGIMEQLWGFSFQSNQANSPVRATDSIISVNHQSAEIFFLQRSGRIYRFRQRVIHRPWHSSFFLHRH